MTEAFFPEKMRVSVGSAMVMGLLKGKMDAKPTTAYLLVCREKKCLANCGFCPQAKDSTSRADMLSRVRWPAFSTQAVLDAIEKASATKKIRRVCIQSLNYPKVFDDILWLVEKIRFRVNVPISVSCKPPKKHQINQMFKAGVNRISIALDATTKEIFEKIKGTKVCGFYSWEKHHSALQEVVNVFGKGFVNTHLIVGLGETEKELCQSIQWCVDFGVYPALFAFTPVLGTVLENESQPPLSSYRRIQVAHYILTQEKVQIQNMEFDDKGKITSFGITNEQVKTIVETGEPFRTSGCPDCNRPYYNEKPSGPFFNYPRQLLPEEIEKEKRSLGF